MIYIRDAKGNTYHVNVAAERATADDVIQTLRDMHLVKAGQEAKLVFRGKVIDSTHTLQGNGVDNGSTINLIIPNMQSRRAMPASDGDGMAGFEEFARTMMQTPMFQQFVNSPEVIRQVVQMDPRLKRLLEEHPEMAEAIEDPDTMRQLTEAATNPELAAELARITDRSINNIESLPGGNAILNRILGSVDEENENEAANVGKRRHTIRKDHITSTGAVMNPWDTSNARRNQAAAMSPFAFPPQPRNSPRHSKSGSNSRNYTSSHHHMGTPTGFSGLGSAGSVRSNPFMPMPSMSQPIPGLTLSPNEQLPQQNPQQGDSAQAPNRPMTLDELRDKFAQQLELIRGMGLCNDEERVLRLLEVTGGNIEAVIERLLSQ